MKNLPLPAGIDLPGLVHTIVARNWRIGAASENKNRSLENWRWTLQTYIGTNNRSPEVVLERAIANACDSSSSQDWANQIPVASGLIAGASDGRRAIDLAQRRSEDVYELIELKIGSDTPLYAAVELLGYASAWLVARHDPPAHRLALLAAKRIDLRVLAPAAFYAPFELRQLESSIADCLSTLGQAEGVELTFAFDVLPDSLISTPLPNGTVLLDVLAGRLPLHLTTHVG